MVSTDYGTVRPCREAGARPAPELAVPSEPFQSPYHEPHGKPQLLPWEGSDPSEGDGHGTCHRPERVRSHGAVAGAAGRLPAARSHSSSLTETFRAATRSPAVNRTRCVCILSKASCILDCSDLNGGEESTARQTASVTASARRSCPCDLVKTCLAVTKVSEPGLLRKWGCTCRPSFWKTRLRCYQRASQEGVRPQRDPTALAQTPRRPPGWTLPSTGAGRQPPTSPQPRRARRWDGCPLGWAPDIGQAPPLLPLLRPSPPPASVGCSGFSRTPQTVKTHPGPTAPPPPAQHPVLPSRLRSGTLGPDSAMRAPRPACGPQSGGGTGPSS